MDLFPELKTKRLRLRKLRVEDVDTLVKYANNRKISDHIINIPYPYQEPDAVFRISYVHQGFKNKSRYVFAITLHEELIGEISLHLDNDRSKAELGYWIAEPFWGRGFASEAAAAVLHFGFERLNLTMIFATCHEENSASKKVLTKSGLNLHHMNGSVMQYVLSKPEYTEFIKTQL